MQDDNGLMALVKDGDKEAYNVIVKKYRVSAISFAYSFLSDLQAAEDAVQDVFINIYLKREKYQPIYTFKTFLYQSVRNKCIDYLRKTKNRTVMDIDGITELVKNCSAEEAFLQLQNEAFLFALMSRLKNDYKTALYLFAVDGASYEEIAKMMKKTTPQVKALIARARKKLKSQYREVLDGEK